MFQFVKVFPHPFVDGPVPPFHGIVGLNDIPTLEHVVGDQHAPGLHQPEHIIQEVDVLSLRRIHKDQVVGLLKLL